MSKASLFRYQTLWIVSIAVITAIFPTSCWVIFWAMNGMIPSMYLYFVFPVLSVIALILVLGAKDGEVWNKRPYLAKKGIAAYLMIEAASLMLAFGIGVLLMWTSFASHPGIEPYRILGLSPHYLFWDLIILFYYLFSTLGGNLILRREKPKEGAIRIILGLALLLGLTFGLQVLIEAPVQEVYSALAHEPLPLSARLVLHTIPCWLGFLVFWSIKWRYSFPETTFTA